MRPSILGFFTVGMTTLSMLSVSCVLYSAGSGVKRVLVVLSGLRWSWFCCVHEAISCKYGCSFACAICLFVSVDVLVHPFITFLWKDFESGMTKVEDWLHGGLIEESYRATSRRHLKRISESKYSMQLWSTMNANT